MLAQQYWFEDLDIDAAKHVAAADIQKAMRDLTKEDFIDCSKENSAVGSEYFSAISIDIDIHHQPSFLVLPTKYCSAFHGAHAFAYWIIKKDKHNNYRLLYEGRSDGIFILKTYTKKMKDIRSDYGNTYIILKFNGTKYSRVGEGGELYPRDN